MQSTDQPIGDLTLASERINSTGPSQDLTHPLLCPADKPAPSTSSTGMPTPHVATQTKYTHSASNKNKIWKTERRLFLSFEAACELLAGDGLLSEC